MIFSHLFKIIIYIYISLYCIFITCIMSILLYTSLYHTVHKSNKYYLQWQLEGMQVYLQYPVPFVSKHISNLCHMEILNCTIFLNYYKEYEPTNFNVWNVQPLKRFPNRKLIVVSSGCGSDDWLEFHLTCSAACWPICLWIESMVFGSTGLLPVMSVT